MRWIIIVLMMTTSVVAHDGPHATDFSRGKWASDHWTPVRVIDQGAVGREQFRQADDALEVGPFTDEQKQVFNDNVMLMTDTGLADGEVALTFSMGEGRGAAPGLFLPSKVEDGIVKEGLGIFVASYTMAIWRISVDEEKGKTKYVSLARLADWTTPNDKHVITLRWSKAAKRIAVQVDDASVLVLRDLPDVLDGRVGIWGCHDVCRFYKMSVTTRPTLTWNAVAPTE